MSKMALLEQALALPVEDQIDLAQRIWEQASPAEDRTLPQPLIELLDARRQEAIENPGASAPWDEVKARLSRNA